MSTDTEILVLVHGTPSAEQSAEQSAQDFIAAGRILPRINGWILIAPAFNQEDFSSRLGDHALGGYRGLFGREIMADAWVLRLVQAFKGLSPFRPAILPVRALGWRSVHRPLPGGPPRSGQAGRHFMQPPPIHNQIQEIAWPFGMGELDADIEWDEGTRTHLMFPTSKVAGCDPGSAYSDCRVERHRGAAGLSRPKRPEPLCDRPKLGPGYGRFRRSKRA